MEHNDNVGQQSISTSHKVNDTTHHKTSSKDGMASTSGTQSVGGGSTNVTATAPLATSTQQGSDARSTTDTLPTYITTSGQPQTATTSTTAATTTVPTANMTTTSSEQQPPTVTTATTAAAAAAAADESALQNQKLVEEFQYLLEKSQSLFSGLRFDVSIEIYHPRVVIDNGDL
ncbi:hypothetical protein BDA99DRAFT_74497 [Phascolomyces articulosus]|uniref:Uncharacterized protein n=1 Tax=Phascolomyces articulosus TaxID=60185 RepID=A0AAD5PE34_9FUNG|nr:hypothetical protein BDA99DRAFT_74497 [Phascolomyces articulosus]